MKEKVVRMLEEVYLLPFMDILGQSSLPFGNTNKTRAPVGIPVAVDPIEVQHQQ